MALFWQRNIRQATRGAMQMTPDKNGQELFRHFKSSMCRAEQRRRPLLAVIATSLKVCPRAFGSTTTWAIGFFIRKILEDRHTESGALGGPACRRNANRNL